MVKKRFNKKLVLIIASLVCLTSLVAVGCGNKQSASASSSKGDVLKPDKDGLIPIKTWTRVDCGSTPWVVADKKGFLKKYGLKVEFTGTTQSAQQIPSVLNGNNDIWDGHPNTYAVAIAGGAPLVGIGPAGIDPGPDVDPKYRHMRWYVNPKSGIKSFKDLVNYKKGQQLKFSTITTNICADFLANTIADKNGLSRDRIEWSSMPDVQAVQTLSQSLVDVAGVHPPYYKAMEDAGMVQIADTADTDLGPTAGLSYYVVTKDFAQKNPEVVKKFVKAMIEAQTWANNNPKEAQELTSKAIGQPVNASHYYATSSKIDDSLIKPWLNELERNKVIPKGKLKPEDIITHKFE
ncbi:ABC transporter substrate-binding protein [Clostridium arbusti]|uniref:ABC transporter substrate-binding protein n=1 Tax=Clostridium arbusti TaxID=1137848 RepID=UPI000287B2F5|nr:ABC transporter substrate-binding protein [Clostridium arbusti]